MRRRRRRRLGAKRMTTGGPGWAIPRFLFGIIVVWIDQIKFKLHIYSGQPGSTPSTSCPHRSAILFHCPHDFITSGGFVLICHWDLYNSQPGFNRIPSFCVQIGQEKKRRESQEGLSLATLSVWRSVNKDGCRGNLKYSASRLHNAQDLDFGWKKKRAL